MPDDSPSRQRHTIKMPKHIIPADAIVVNKELGTGEFGVVQQGVWTNEEGHRVSSASRRRRLTRVTRSHCMSVVIYVVCEF